MANKTTKAPKDSAPKKAPEGKIPEDIIIEGEVSARDDKVPLYDKAPQKTNMTGSIFAILFSLIALGLVSLLTYERQISDDVIDDKLALLAADIAEIQNQTLAQKQEVAKLAVALQEAIAAKPEVEAAANPRQAAGLIALMMWQDMRAGQKLDAYQPFVMTLSDEAARARLVAVIAAWQTLDYQGLLAKGRAFLEGTKADDSDEAHASGTVPDDILSGFGRWVAGLVKLEPLTPPKEMEKEILVEAIGAQANVLTPPSLDEILIATATQQGAEIAAWRSAAQEVATQQAQLSAFIIDHLTEEVILP